MSALFQIFEKNTRLETLEHVFITYWLIKRCVHDENDRLLLSSLITLKTTQHHCFSNPVLLWKCGSNWYIVLFHRVAFSSQRRRSRRRRFSFSVEPALQFGLPSMPACLVHSCFKKRSVASKKTKFTAARVWSRFPAYETYKQGCRSAPVHFDDVSWIYCSFCNGFSNKQPVVDLFSIISYF